jgi:putative membrane protein
MSPPSGAVVVDPLLLLGVAIAMAPIAWQLRCSGDTGNGWRWASLAGASLLLLGTFVSPIQTLAQHYLLSAHLVQVLVLMGAAPPLMLLALPPTPAPARGGPLRRAGVILTHPGIAIVNVNAVFFLTHWAPVFQFGMAHTWLFDLSLLALLATSVAFWWPIIGPPGRRAVLSPLGKLGYILLATIPQTFAGLTVALSPQLVYGAYASAPRLLDLSAHADQQIAGASLAILSKVALFAAFSVIFVRVMNPGPDSDDGGGGGGPYHEPAPSPPGEPAWYREMGEGRVRPEPLGRRRVEEPRVPVAR